MNEELYHHGIIGQKWGVRRYQNPDGTLTKLGRKRLGYKTQSQLSTIRNRLTRPKTVAKSDAPKKSLRDMDVDELSEVKRKLELTKDIYKLNSDISSYTPKHVSMGKKFVDGLVGDVVAPAAKDVGKKFLEKQLTRILKLDKDEIKQLEKAAKKAELEANIAKNTRLKKDYSDGSDDKTKQLEKAIEQLTLQKQYKALKTELSEDTSVLDNLKRKAELAKLNKDIAEAAKATRDAKKSNTSSGSRKIALKPDDINKLFNLKAPADRQAALDLLGVDTIEEAKAILFGLTKQP